MKKSRALLSMLLVFCFVLTLFTSVYGAEPTTDEKADALSKLSLIAGDGNGYNLDGLLKRYEAAVFIVRLLGKSEYVSENSSTLSETGFSDTPSTLWYASYIGYCTENQIISGYGNGKFAPNGLVTEKTFISMLLRALGYSAGSDFAWDTVYRKAYTAGLVSDSAYLDKSADNTDFTRGDLVDLMYTALRAKPKDSEVTLIESLISDGVITKEEAAEAGFSLDKLATDIDDVTATAQNKLTIIFNEDIDSISSADMAIYETEDFTKRLEGDVYSLKGKELVVDTGMQTPGMDYTVELSNVTDLEGNVVDKVTASFTGYKMVKNESDFFRIEKVEPENNKVISVYFTQPVNANAELPFNYEILDGSSPFVEGSYQTLTVKLIPGTNNGVTVNLNNLEFTEGKTYMLKVSGDLNSLYGTYLNEGEDDQFAFTGSEDENSKLAPVSVKAVDRGTVQVEFNNFIDTFYGEQYLNYKVLNADGDSIAVGKASLVGTGSKYGKVLNLGLVESLDTSEQYTLIINFLPDLFKSSTISSGQYKFSGKYTENTLKPTGVKAVDKGTITLTFSKALDPATAVDEDNYYVSGVSQSGYFASPEAVYYSEPGGVPTVKLYMASSSLMTGGKQYRVTVSSGLKDSAGSRLDTDKSLSFTGSSNSDVKPHISEAMIISSDTVKVTFNREIAADRPNILASNYYLEYKQDGQTVKRLPDIASYIDEQTIVLKFNNLDPDTKYKLYFNALSDFPGIYTSTASDKNYADVVMGKK